MKRKIITFITILIALIGASAFWSEAASWAAEGVRIEDDLQASAQEEGVLTEDDLQMPDQAEEALTGTAMEAEDTAGNLDGVILETDNTAGDPEDASADSIVIESVEESAVRPLELQEGEAELASIDEAHFPDSVFREIVSQYDSDEDGSLSVSEREAVSSLNLSYSSIKKILTNLTGIEYFHKLEYLYCDSQALTSLDVSGNTSLKKVTCQYNMLTNLTLGNNTGLQEVWCKGNALAELDVTANTALTTLYCDGNKLTSLDVRQNSALVYLGCTENQLTELDLSGNPLLWLLSCNDNQLSRLDVSGKEKLAGVYCSGNVLTSLDLAGTPELDEVNCPNNRLTELDVSQSPKLKYLYCANNQLSSLDVSANPELICLNCPSNCLSMLDLSANTKLQDQYYGIFETDISNQKAVLPVRLFGGAWQLDMEEIVGEGKLEWIVESTFPVEDKESWDGIVDFGQEEHPDLTTVYLYRVDTHAPEQGDGEPADWRIMTVEASMEEIPHTEHTWGEWTTVSEATVLEPEQQQRVCLGCGITESRSYGDVLQQTEGQDGTAPGEDGADSGEDGQTGGGSGADLPESGQADEAGLPENGQAGEAGSSEGGQTGIEGGAGLPENSQTGEESGETASDTSGETSPQIAVSVSSPRVMETGGAKVIPLAVKQSVRLKLPDLSADDSIISWKSSNTKVASVSKKGKVTGKKAGLAKITARLKSGTTVSVKIKVRKKAVKTKEIRFTDGKAVTISAGKKKTLNVSLRPATSSEKERFYSSDSRVVKVNNRGVITGVKKGTAVVTVRSGAKTARIKVTVK